MRRCDFIANALNSDVDGCIVWPYAVRKSSGYGAHSDRVNGATKNYDIHRYVCEKAHGAPPEQNHQAAHACGNKLCINKNHLRWASPKANMHDAILHGTMRGGGRGRQRLFAHERAYIRQTPKSLVVLGREFGMDPAHIGRVRRSCAP